MRVYHLVAGLLSTVHCSARDTYEPFLEWLRAKEADFGAKLEPGVDEVTGLRGLLAGGPISNGSALFSLPSSLILTAEVARKQGVAWNQIVAADKGESELLSPIHTALALFVLEQRASGAPWHAWASVLPESFDGFPLFYTEEDLAGLQASPLRRVVTLDQQSVAHDFAVAAKFRANLTLDEFRWARIAVKSRVFGLRSLSGGRLSEEVIAMVPLADFVNHPPDGVVEANVAPSYDVETGTFRFRAVRDISAKEGIYWDYGFKSNRNSLTRYGFASQKRISLTDMPLIFSLNDLMIPGESTQLKKDHIEKAKSAGTLAMDEDGSVLHELSLTLTGAHATRLLGHMRFAALTVTKASVLEEYCGDTYCRPIGLPNERRALQLLSKQLEKFIVSYGTTAGKDKGAIDSGEVAPHSTQWNTLIVRYGEKMILNGFVRLLAALDPLFDLSPWALENVVKEKWGDPRSDIHQYVQRNITDLMELEAKRWAKRKLKEKKEERVEL